MSKEILFEPFNLADLKLNNRLVMAPMTRGRSNNDGHVATALTAAYYEQRASAGLQITEGTFVSKKAVGFVNVPAIYSEEQTKGWKLVTDAVHKEGGVIFAQLWHVGRMSHPDLHEGELPHAPSAINPHAKAYTHSGFVDTVTPKEMSKADIEQTIADFKHAAANAVAAGFDGVELHAANGYLLHQFFVGNANIRTDEYGGSIDNRARILFEVLDAVAEVIPKNGIGIRFNPSTHGLFGMNIDEQTIPTYEYMVEKLNAYGLAYLHFMEPFTDVSEVPYAVTEVAKHFRPLYNGTLIINNGFDKQTGNAILENGYADLVAYGKPFIANPDLVARYEQNAPLAEADPATFYTTGTLGYTDYPFMNN